MPTFCGAAGTEYLHTNRMKYMACEVFKIANEISPLCIQDLIALKHTQYSMRQDYSAVVPPARTTKYGLKSVMHEGPRVWNSLPNDIRIADNFSKTSSELG